MFCGLQRAWASKKPGTRKGGVPRKRSRSRHESSIHNFGLGPLTGEGGTVCRRENAGSCCMNSGTKFSLTRGENQSQSSRQEPVLIVDLCAHFPNRARS